MIRKNWFRLSSQVCSLGERNTFKMQARHILFKSGTAEDFTVFKVVNAKFNPSG